MVGCLCCFESVLQNYERGLKTYSSIEQQLAQDKYYSKLSYKTNSTLTPENPLPKANVYLAVRPKG